MPALKVNQFKINQAAKFLGVSSKTLRRWEARSVLIPTRTPGNQRVYELNSLVEFRRNLRTIRSQTRKAPVFTGDQVKDNLLHIERNPQKFVKEFEILPAQKVVLTSFAIGLIAVGSLVLLNKRGIVRISDLEKNQTAVSNALIKTREKIGPSIMAAAFPSVNPFNKVDQNIAYSSLKDQAVLAAVDIEDSIFGIAIPSKFAKDVEVVGNLTAPNITYTVTGGTGISVTGGQNPVVALAAGALNGFDTVTVGTTNIVADGSDTLTFAAGSNVSLALDTAAKKLTISSTDTDTTGGWTDDGTNIRLTTLSDTVTIGSSLIISDGGLINLSAVLHDDSAPQGLKLPQNTTLTNISSGEGFLAYDSDDNLVKIFDGSSWTTVGGNATGDITAVIAGSGLTGGAASGDATLDVGGSSTITVAADAISVTADSIGDTELTFNTGQSLTTASTPTFAGLTLNGNLDMTADLILNIGNAGTDFSAAGGLSLADDLAVNGGDITTSQTTFNLINATATTLNLGGAATTFNIAPTGASGSVVLSGGSADTGCTLDGTTGNLTCSGSVTGSGGAFASTLQNAYDNDVNGSDVLITLNTTDGNLIFKPIAGTNFQVAQVTSAPTTDIVAITNAGLGTTTNGVDGLSINFVTGDGSNPTNSGVNIALTSGGSGSGDVLNGINLSLSGTSGTERGINFVDNNFDLDINALTDLNIGIGGTSALKVAATGITSLGNVAHTIVDSSGALAIDSNSTGAINIGTGANAKTITIGNNTTSTALAFNSGTGSQTFTSNVVSGTTTTSGFVFDATAITSGTGLFATSDSITTGKLVDINTLAANTLTSGQLLNVYSSSTGLTSGNLALFDWSPSPSATATGDLVKIHIGPQGDLNGGNLLNILSDTTSLFSVSETAITNSIPTAFNATGDVSVAYDLVFTNQIASYIKSSAPLYLEAGETFENNNLTLRTFGTGNVVFDLTGAGGKLNIDAASTDNTTTTGVLDLNVDSATTSNVGLNIDYTSVSGVTAAADLFAAKINLVQNDADGDLFGLWIDNNANSTTLSGTNYVDCLLCLNNSENTAASVLNAIYIASSGSTAGAITNGINIATTDVTTDIVLQNGETVDNNVDGQINLNTGVAAAGDGIYIDSGQTTSTANGLCHSGADADNAAFSDRQIVACAGTVDADFAEQYPVASDVQLGDLVALGSREVTTTSGTTIRQLIKTTSTYQQTAIGVVSNNYSDFASAGYDIPQAENPKPIALVGRVVTKVSSQNGPIEVGDTIASSTIPGVGMKAKSAGFIIGRAISGYNNSDPNAIGTIMVYINASWADPSQALAFDSNGNVIANNPQPAISNTYEAQIADLQSRVGALEQQATGSSVLNATDSGGLNDTVNLLSSRLDYLQSQIELIQTSSPSAEVSQVATSSGSLADLLVLGNSVLSDTVINGKLTIGNITIDNINSSIDALGVLKIQDSNIADIQFQGDKIEMNQAGDLVIKEGVIAGNDTFRGKASFAAGETSFTVDKSGVWTAAPITIQVTPSFKATAWVTDITENGFTINVSSAPTTTKDLYWTAIW